MASWGYPTEETTCCRTFIVAITAGVHVLFHSKIDRFGLVLFGFFGGGAGLFCLTCDRQGVLSRADGAADGSTGADQAFVKDYTCEVLLFMWRHFVTAM